MSHKRTGRLSRAVVALWIVVDSLERPSPRSGDLNDPIEVPNEVDRVALAVKRAAVPPNPNEQKPYEPKVRLNRSLAALHREDPELFPRVQRWLLKDAVRERFSQKGHSSTWHRWVQGTKKIQEGKVPTQALGMGEAGRSRSTFSVYEDAALYAEYLREVEGVPSEKATERAQALGSRTLDRRKVQKWRKVVREMRPKANKKLEKREAELREQYQTMLQEQYKAIAQKYGLK